MTTRFTRRCASIVSPPYCHPPPVPPVPPVPPPPDIHLVCHVTWHWWKWSWWWDLATGFRLKPTYKPPNTFGNSPKNSLFYWTSVVFSQAADTHECFLNTKLLRDTRLLGQLDFTHIQPYSTDPLSVEFKWQSDHSRAYVNVYIRQRPP